MALSKLADKTIRKMGRLRNLNTIQNMLFLLLSAVLVPLALLQASIYYNRFVERRVHAMETNLAVARSVAATFSDFITDVMRQELVIGSTIARVPMSKENLIWLLEMGNMKQGLIPGLIWADETGRVIAATQEQQIAGQELGDTAFFQEISSGKDWALSNLGLCKITGKPQVCLGRAIRNKGGRIEGVLVTRIVPEELNRLLGLERTARECAITFIDGKGSAVFSYSEKDKTRPEWLHQIQAMKRNADTREMISEVSTEGGRKYFTALSPVDGTDWSVVSSRSESEAVEPIIHLLLYESGMFFLVILLSLSMGLALSRIIVEPIRTLRKRARSLEISGPSPGTDVRGPVELQDLAETFRVMEIKIRKREEELRSSRDNLEVCVQERTGRLNKTLEALCKEMEERSQAERKIIQSNKLLQTVFDGISEPLMMLGPDMNVRILNEFCRQHYGVSTGDDVIGKPCYEGFMKRDTPCELCPVPACISKNNPIIFERTGIIDPCKTEQVAIYPIKDKEQDGGIILRVCDITEKMIMQKQMMQADRLASLGQLSGGIAHEIRNPLMGISLFADLLGDEEIFSRTAREIKIIDEIRGNIQRINHIIKKVLDFARQSDSRFSEIDLAPLINETLKLCHHSIEAGTNVLNVTMEKPLPRIQGDAIEIQQVVTNLVQNAFEAIPPDGQVDVNVYTGKHSCNRNHPAVIIEIRDSGPGIAPAHSKNIFNPFYTTKAMGTGLGLPISHQIVTRHGGTISFESTPGRGTTFRVELPVPAGGCDA